MIHIHEHPICEYDEERNAIIRAADFLERCLPEKCVITFFRKELEQFVQELCLSIRNCIKRAPKSTVPGQHRFGFEKPRFCSL